MRRGGGVGYDFSRIRPRGAWVGSTQTSASGPVSYMRVFDRSCETVESAGARRGAQMGVLRCDHPDIEEFIHAKDRRRPGELQHLGRRDRCVHAGGRGRRRGRAGAPGRAGPARRRKPAPTQTQGDGTGSGSTARCRARALWDQIMQSTYDHAEPGVLFLDRINRDNNLSYCESDRGDQPVRRAAAAVLRLLLPRLDRPDALRRRRRSRRRRASTKRHSPRSRRWRCGCSTTCSTSPSGRCRSSARKRAASAASASASPGLGDALVMLGLRYDTAPRRAAMARRMAEAMRDAAYDASVDLARERGAFPLFNADLYLSGDDLRLAPVAAAARPHPRARPAQLAPAVDRADRHDQPGLRRQREQRHRAGVQLELHAQEADGRRQLQGICGRGSRLAAVPAPEGRGGAADAGVRDRAAR